ncbi:choline-sulfatase [Roseovarius spongiae]|uniref:choline-sulfatase n=1 Tax=Roseovarius spongiae TaxID=2320272 RepID=UPI00197E3FEA|nr:choline-sulfatase [Roseovarius spongiae]
MTRPNILFIQCDQLTADVLNAYGNDIAVTPNLDRLAEGGLVFENAYCNYPLCSPSRASMAAGMLASRIGAYDNASEFPASIPTYAHYMRALGYQTCLSGKMHFIGPDQLHGFERRLTSDVYPSDFTWTPDWLADGFHGATDMRMLTVSGPSARNVQIDYDEDVAARAVQFIYDAPRAQDTRPFFLQVSFTHPHDPYLCQPKHWDLYPDGVPMPRTARPDDADNDPHSLRILFQHGLRDAEITDEMIQRARRAYCGSVSFIDDKIGDLMAALAQSGQAGNTVIVFTTDHGEMLGERGLWLKKTFFDGSTRLPFIMNGAGRIEPGRSAALVSLVDLLPTLVALGATGDAPAPVDDLDGTDILALPRAGFGERPMLGELLCEGINAPIFMIRRGRFKLVMSEGDPPMLFDLEADPEERTNLARDPAHAGTLKELGDEVRQRWDNAALSRDVLRSQQRRQLINKATEQGIKPRWDHTPTDDSDERYYRNKQHYNTWAFDHLEAPSTGD